MTVALESSLLARQPEPAADRQLEPPASKPKLKRELGLWGSVGLGLASIIGTGIFVSISIAAQATGPSIIIAMPIAAITATCNALNSAQLAANCPTSGGTYEYGYRYLNKYLGFTAGWLFTAAKCASGASAALGFATYILSTTDRPDLANQYGPVVGVAMALHVLLTLITLSGLRRSNRVNFGMLAIVISSLLFFILGAIPNAQSRRITDVPLFSDGPVGFLRATALCFVAFTGYGRVATLGEEVREPRKTIPRAIVVTLLCSAVLYVSVCLMAILSADLSVLTGTNDGTVKSTGSAPLADVAKSWTAVQGGWYVLTVGAIVSMSGVLLNLLLGLSRMIVAMARRRDMPASLENIREIHGAPTPVPALLFISAIIAALIFIGNVKAAWSFSAFTVLVYYAICNAAAYRLPAEQRLFSRWWSVGGFLSCLLLAFFVEFLYWIVGIGLILFGLVYQQFINRYYARRERKVSNHTEFADQSSVPMVSLLAQAQENPVAMI